MMNFWQIIKPFGVFGSWDFYEMKVGDYVILSVTWISEEYAKFCIVFLCHPFLIILESIYL